MATPQPAVLNRNMGQHQWYVHLSRLDDADMGVIKSAVQQLRKDCADKGINLTIGLGPSLLSDLTNDGPNDFQPYETFQSIDGSGKEAKGTQEELLFWLNSEKKDEVWKAQWDAREALKGHMRVARETMTFIFRRLARPVRLQRWHRQPRARAGR